MGQVNNASQNYQHMPTFKGQIVQRLEPVTSNKSPLRGVYNNSCDLKALKYYQISPILTYVHWRK